MYDQMQMQQTTGQAFGGGALPGNPTMPSGVAPAPSVTVLDVVQRHDGQLMDLQKGLADAHEQIRFLRARLGL